MSALDDAYARRDKSRLEIGSLALELIELRVTEEMEAGKTAPRRTILSEILECLSQEYAKYHSSAKSCRSYLSDSIRLSRFYTPDVTAELEQYHFTTGMMLACLVKSEEWPEANITATQSLIDWAIKNNADSEAIWHRRKENEIMLSKEESQWKKVLKSIDKYLEISAPLSGEEISARRQACILFAQANPDKERE